MAALAVGSLCFVGTAAGQDLRPIKPKAEASPAPPEAGPTAEKTKKGGNLSAKDKSFMMNAAKGGMMEVEWGKLAAENAQSADVKKFGNRMVTDHSKANEELMALAQEEGVKLPSEKAGGKWKSDKDYMDMMVKDHEKDLAEFESEAKKIQQDGQATTSQLASLLAGTSFLPAQLRPCNRSPIRRSVSCN